MAEKVEAKAFLEFAAGVLGVSEGRLSLETTYGSIPEWDSMAQLAARWRETGRNALVKELFERFGFKQEFESASEKRYSKILTQRHGGTEG